LWRARESLEHETNRLHWNWNTTKLQNRPAEMLGQKETNLCL